MQCNYFGICGSCRDFSQGYEGQLLNKMQHVEELFLPFYGQKISQFQSFESHYRARAEFKIYHDNGTINYAMNRIDKQGMICIDQCPIVSPSIEKVMKQLLEKIQAHNLQNKLFGVDFLSAKSGEVCVTLLYHRPLDESWVEKAKEIENDLKIYIIGRSRKQKVVLSKDFVLESLNVGNRAYFFQHVENSFTQPNTHVNEQMIEWSLEQLSGIGGDLLELYCGAGNFTIPFATKFDKVLATEISKTSIQAAMKNMQLNDIHNINFVRMSAEEFTQALDGVREFRRMKEIDLKNYELSTIFVDPPRAGLGEEPCNFAARFENILYISCNPETLARDLELLSKTHKVVSMAAFDQFPYTHHLEMGVKLQRR